MEGFLLLRETSTFGMKSYNKRWVCLSTNSFMVYTEQKGKLLEMLSIRFLKVKESSEIQTDFTVFSIVKSLKFRASSAAECQKWISMIQLQRENEGIERQKVMALRKANELKLSKNGDKSDPLSQLLGGSTFNSIEDELGLLFEIQARLAESLSREPPESNVRAHSEQLLLLSNEIKKSFQKTTHMFDEEKNNLIVVRNHLDSTIKSGDQSERTINRALVRLLDEKSNTHSVNESSGFFDPIQDYEELKRLRKSFLRLPEGSKYDPSENMETVNEKQGGLRFDSDYLYVKDSSIRELLQTNAAFLKFPVNPATPSSRESLPALRDPDQRPSLFKLLRSMVGRDLTRISMPCFLNEAASATHSGGNVLNYAKILEKANRCTEASRRALHVLSFLVTNVMDIRERNKKPFNPILGETYERVNENGRVIVEQVSHHPPINAMFFESDDAEYLASLEVSIKFSMSKGFELQVVNPINVYLKTHKEHYLFKMPSIKTKNVLSGRIYVVYEGLMQCTNTKTGEIAEVEFIPENGVKGVRFPMKGRVVSAEGETVFNLEGEYDKELRATSVLTGKTEVAAKLSTDRPANYEQQYFFDNFNINANHLTPEMLQKIPRTDARLRSDLRAYENGDWDLAESEKIRLEEKQRAQRKVFEAQGRKYKPIWFETDLTNEPPYRFKGEYWKCRETGQWPEEMLDIF